MDKEIEIFEKKLRSVKEQRIQYFFGLFKIWIIKREFSCSSTESDKVFKSILISSLSSKVIRIVAANKEQKLKAIENNFCFKLDNRDII